MTTRIGINGFGRIGRDFVRAALDDPDLEIVAVNDLADRAVLARLLRHDSTFGPLRHAVEEHPDGIAVDGNKIAMTAEREPANIPWAQAGVDVVIEASGKFRTRTAAAAHLGTSVRKVIVSAPGKGMDATIVLGVNDERYDPAAHDVISNASCTTNCAAPMAKVLHEAFGIERGYLTTVHAYTSDQNLLDGIHKDARRSRSAAVNIIPTSTGAARAIGDVIPALAGRLDGVAVRVPVVNGSLVDLTVTCDRPVTTAEVNQAFEQAATSGPLAGLLHYSTEPLVSGDIIGDPASCVFDSDLTRADDRLVTIFGWYDNEWGYTARLVDLARLVGTQLQPTGRP